MLLTLCTGNAARSVMAGALLEEAPMEIVTAGTHVIEGQPMSRRTRAAMEAVGVSAPLHRSHQMTEEDVARATLILCMAGDHVSYIRRRHPEAAARTASLKRLVQQLPAGPPPLAERLAALELASWPIEEFDDVEDPAGGADEIYVACAEELAALCTALLPKLA